LSLDIDIAIAIAIELYRVAIVGIRFAGSGIRAAIGGLLLPFTLSRPRRERLPCARLTYVARRTGLCHNDNSYILIWRPHLLRRRVIWGIAYI
jgi:hypothetical protein